MAQQWAGDTGPNLQAKNIGKIMQDHVRMFTSENADEFDVDLTKMLQMTKFLGDATLDQYDVHKHRWIIWNEMTGNIFPRLHQLAFSYLGDKPVDTAERTLLDSYRTLMYGKVAPFINNFYPDKQCVPFGSDNGYDLSQARIASMLTRYAMDYAPAGSYVFTSANELALGTAAGNCGFIDQSPDTRGMTFDAAVAAESGSDQSLKHFFLSMPHNLTVENVIFY